MATLLETAGAPSSITRPWFGAPIPSLICYAVYYYESRSPMTSRDA